IKQPRWHTPSVAWLKECERCIATESKLAAVLKGEAAPSDAGTSIELAWHCLHYKHLNASAARFYLSAFEAQPDLAANRDRSHRYHAACAAVLAGCGQGEDAVRLDEPERARLRQQALDWLRADLE